MKTTDLYIKTPSREAFFRDLLDTGLIEITPSCNGLPKSGISIDYIGQIVKTAASYGDGPDGPVETVPAEYYDGEYANMRLVGAAADEIEAALRGQTFAHGTEVIEKPENPKRVWA